METWTLKDGVWSKTMVKGQRSVMAQVRQADEGFEIRAGSFAGWCESRTSSFTEWTKQCAGTRSVIEQQYAAKRAATRLAKKALGGR